MDNRRVPINVSVNPSEYSGRSSSIISNSTRLGSIPTHPETSLRDKMSQRMQEFEEESRKWREQFLASSSGLSPAATTSDLHMHHRPRMFLNFPDMSFGDMNSSFGATPTPPLSRLGGGASSSLSQNHHHQHKSFVEEDDMGRKKYKMQFEIGDFKPAEIQVRTEGRQLVVKGEREYKAGSAVESKQFNREITLPDFVEPTSVVSFLSDDGVLTVEAPVSGDRLEYGSGAQTAALRHSPLRDAGSSRISNTTSSSNNNSHHAATASSLASQSSFSTSPLYSELPSNPVVQLGSTNSQTWVI